MSLAGGRAYRAIPGPSVMPDEVLQAMHRPSPNIYGGALAELTEGILDDLKMVARTKGDAAIYICNGHGTWEAALANILAPGDKVLVPATGLFGHGWAEMARRLGADVEVIDFGTSSPVDPAKIEEALRGDKSGDIKAVLLTFVDTSSSIRNDVKAVRAAMDACDHPALLAADCIASLGCDRFEMDDWGVDITLTGSQKGLMVPPGLGFVFFSEKAARVRDGLTQVSPYWDWKPRVQPNVFYQYFCGTAPTHHLFGLRAALDMIKAEGLEAVWARHEHLAHAIWAAAEVWGQGGPLRMNIADPDLRSRAVTSLSMDPPDGSRLREWVEKEAGVTLGIGLGMETPDDPNSDRAFRIGHMGHVNGHMILGVLGAIEAALVALDIPHGPGGASAAAKVLAAGG